MGLLQAWTQVKYPIDRRRVAPPVWLQRPSSGKKGLSVKRGVKRVKFVKATFLACDYQTGAVRITRGGPDGQRDPRHWQNREPCVAHPSQLAAALAVIAAPASLAAVRPEWPRRCRGREGLTAGRGRGRIR